MLWSSEKRRDLRINEFEGMIYWVMQLGAEEKEGLESKDKPSEPGGIGAGL